VLTKERRFQEAFSVVAVDDDRIFDVAWISGIIPILRQYSKQRLKGELSRAEVRLRRATRPLRTTVKTMVAKANPCSHLSCSWVAWVAPIKALMKAPMNAWCGVLDESHATSCLVPSIAARRQQPTRDRRCRWEPCQLCCSSDTYVRPANLC
jgi:hypothetical protein